MDKRSWTLDFSMPLSPERDRPNLARSGVKRVMLPFAIAARHPDQVAWLGQNGYAVILRMEQESYHADLSYTNGRIVPTPGGKSEHDKAAEALTYLHRAVRDAPIEGVAIGVEPDLPRLPYYNYRGWLDDKVNGDGSVSAGAKRHKVYFATMHRAIKGAFPQMHTISGGLSCPFRAEGDMPYPGYVAWRDEVAEVYSEADTNAFHAYTYNAISPCPDQLRLQFIVQFGASMWHKRIDLLELGVLFEPENGVRKLGLEWQLRRMQAYIDFANWLDLPWQRDVDQDGHPYKTGGRVRLYSPFVSNGVPSAWPEEYLLDRPEVYDLLRRHVDQ
jgi:hypothetical protein